MPRPSRSPGILRSVSTMSNCLVRSFSSASPPLLAAVTSWPARRRQIARNSRIDCSSSTTRIWPTPDYTCLDDAATRGWGAVRWVGHPLLKIEHDIDIRVLACLQRDRALIVALPGTVVEAEVDDVDARLE